MSNIEKFDPSKLMDGVKDRIKATFVSLIPDDQWEIMVKKEIDEFFREYNSGTQKRSSDFQKLVFEALETKVKETIAKVFGEYTAGGYWATNERIVNEKIQNLISEHSGLILSSILGQHIETFLQQLRNSFTGRF